MTFVDSSAITAVLTEEDDARELVARLEKYPLRVTSPLAVWETAVAVARRLDLDIPEATAAVENVLLVLGVKVQDLPAAARALALEAFDRFGKGRHPAGLNFGDCFSYACARLAGVPLLYKGNNFSRTDIEPA